MEQPEELRKVEENFFIPNNIPIHVCLSHNVLGGNTYKASLIAQLVKHLPAMQETPVRFLGQEDVHIGRMPCEDEDRDRGDALQAKERQRLSTNHQNQEERPGHILPSQPSEGTHPANT